MIPIAKTFRRCDGRRRLALSFKRRQNPPTKARSQLQKQQGTRVAHFAWLWRKRGNISRSTRVGMAYWSQCVRRLPHTPTMQTREGEKAKH